MKAVFSILILAFLTQSLWAKKTRLEQAYAAYQADEYLEAIDKLKDVYNQISDRTEKTKMVFYIANCYRKTSQPLKAEVWFKKAIQRGYPDPLAILYYADAMKMNEKYEEASEQYDIYKVKVPDDPRAENGLEACKKAIVWKENPNGYRVEELKYFNSSENDYAPAFAKEDYAVIYFTSSREGSTGDKKHGATGENFTDIFYSARDRKGKWSTPLPLPETINSSFEEGTPSLNLTYDRMYYARCEVKDDTEMGCAIYMTEKKGEDWNDAFNLEIKSDSIVLAHPAIAPDELTLYFVSDMEGGFGGKDIWKVERAAISDKWGPPINLGDPINTEANEVFPYVHPDGTFYFASDGHVGMGGLDIYKTKKNGGETIIENLKYPINSSADDFGIAYEQDVERGFFTSNRNSRGDDNIYSFYLPPLKYNIVGTVKDEKTDEALVGAKVKSIGSNGITLQTTTGNDGTFKFMLKPGTDYVFVASKEDYLNGKIKETTKGLTQSKDFYPSVFLTSTKSAIQLSHSDVFYDLGKWNLRPEALVALDNLVTVLIDNPHITIELMAHTDSRGSDQANLELSQKRADAVIEYLIKKGIDKERLTARGYGETVPKVVDKIMAEKYTFLREGAKLNEEYIESLETEEQKERAHQNNRRTEFKVLTTDYKLE